MKSLRERHAFCLGVGGEVFDVAEHVSNCALSFHKYHHSPSYMKKYVQEQYLPFVQMYPRRSEGYCCQWTIPRPLHPDDHADDRNLTPGKPRRPQHRFKGYLLACQTWDNSWKLGDWIPVPVEIRDKVAASWACTGLEYPVQLMEHKNEHFFPKS